MGLRSQKLSIPKTQIDQGLIEQTGIIFQIVRKFAMQPHIKYKAYYDQKANAPKLKKRYYVHML